MFKAEITHICTFDVNNMISNSVLSKYLRNIYAALKITNIKLAWRADLVQGLKGRWTKTRNDQYLWLKFPWYIYVSCCRFHSTFSSFAFFWLRIKDAHNFGFKGVKITKCECISRLEYIVANWIWILEHKQT